MDEINATRSRPNISHLNVQQPRAFRGKNLERRQQPTQPLARLLQTRDLGRRKDDQSDVLYSGFSFRLVEAISSSSSSVIESNIDFEAPFSSLTFVSPRFAASAAPAAFCCAFDFAGMTDSSVDAAYFCNPSSSCRFPSRFQIEPL
jgi:hypothetical protein